MLVPTNEDLGTGVHDYLKHHMWLSLPMAARRSGARSLAAIPAAGDWCGLGGRWGATDHQPSLSGEPAR